MAEYQKTRSRPRSRWRPASWCSRNQVAQIYALRGDKDRAFAWLQRAYVQHDGGFVAVLPNNCSIKCDALLRNLSADPRYTVLLKEDEPAGGLSGP